MTWDSSICYLCKKHFAENDTKITIDYSSATGRETLPSVNSPNYDDRYGFIVHRPCFDKRMAKLDKQQNKKGENKS